MSPRNTTDISIFILIVLASLCLLFAALPIIAQETDDLDLMPDTLDADSLQEDSISEELSDSVQLDSLKQDSLGVELPDSTIADTLIEDTTDSVVFEQEAEIELTLEDTIQMVQGALRQEFWPKQVMVTVILSDTNIRYSWLPEIEGIHFIIMDKKRRQEKALRGGDFMYHRVGNVELADSVAVLKIHYEWEPPHRTDPEYMEVWFVKDKKRWRASKVFHYREVEN